MIQNKKLLYLILFFLVSACSSIPKNTADGCSIFSERYLWYKHAKKTERKWGTPIYIQLAIIKMESDFDWLAKPERRKIFKVIPYKRPSSSFGYSQAVKGTWKQYKQETNNSLATRVRFKDSVDLIGWYTNKSEKILIIIFSFFFSNFFFPFPWIFKLHIPNTQFIHLCIFLIVCKFSF